MIRAHQYASKKSSSNVLEADVKEEGGKEKGETKDKVHGHDLELVGNKRDEVHNVILDSISKSAEASGADSDHAHPVITMMAEYDWSGGVAKAGMSWGAVGHAIEHVKDEETGVKRKTRYDRFKRSNSVM